MTEISGMSPANIRSIASDAKQEITQDLQQTIERCDAIINDPTSTDDEKKIATAAKEHAEIQGTINTSLIDAHAHTVAQQVAGGDTRHVEDFIEGTTSLAENAESIFSSFNAEMDQIASAPPSFDELMSDPEQLLELYNDDPAAFTEFYKDLSSDDRQAMMTRLNQEMQLNQQMMSLLSNLMQAAHQTSRAVIQNLRV